MNHVQQSLTLYELGSYDLLTMSKNTLRKLYHSTNKRAKAHPHDPSLAAAAESLSDALIQRSKSKKSAEETQ